MQTIYKWLVPGFLKRWDTWLLERYPIVWRTRAHYVLFYALVATVLLFVLGFFYPVSATDLRVDPICPIILGDEYFYIIPLAVLSLGILYWGYTQYQTGFPSAKPKYVLLTLLIYGICLFVITGISTPAFRIGTIVHTAYCLIDTADIKYWEENNYFLYGCICKGSDSSYLKPNDAFFLEGEATFQYLWKAEEVILTNRYDNHGMDKLIWRISYKEYQSNILELSVSFPDVSFPLDLPWSYLSERPYLSNRPYLSYLSSDSDQLDHQDDGSYRYFLSYLSYLTCSVERRDLLEMDFESYRSDRSDQLDRSGLSYPLKYWNYYERSKLPQINTSILKKYKIPLLNDSIPLDSSIFIRPGYIYDMEDAIRSVHHARQYLKEGILFRHWRILMCFLPLLALLLFAAPYLSFRSVLVVFIVIGICGASLIMALKIDQQFFDKAYYRNSNVNLMLSLLGLFHLAFSAVQGKFSKYNTLAFHLIFFSLSVTLFFAIMGNKWAFAEKTLQMNKPSDLAFFGVQVIGLAGVLLMAYLQALPKRV